MPQDNWLHCLNKNEVVVSGKFNSRVWRICIPLSEWGTFSGDANVLASNPFEKDLVHKVQLIQKDDYDYWEQLMEAVHKLACHNKDLKLREAHVLEIEYALRALLNNNSLSVAA